MRGEALDVANQKGLVPCRHEIAGEAAHEHDVRRSFAYDLVCDRDFRSARRSVAHRGADKGIAV